MPEKFDSFNHEESEKRENILSQDQLNDFVEVGLI